MYGNNIIIEVLDQDEESSALKVTMLSSYVAAYREIDVYFDDLYRIGEEFTSFISAYRVEKQIEFITYGVRGQNYPVAISIKLLPADLLGHVAIDMCLWITDNDDGKHSCSAFIKGDLGAIERLGRNLSALTKRGVGAISSLYPLEQ